LCRVYNTTPHSQGNNMGRPTYKHNTSHVSSCDKSAPCSPSRLSLRTALMCRGFITKDTSGCRLICAAIWRPCSTTNEGGSLGTTLDHETCRTASVSPDHKAQLTNFITYSHIKVKLCLCQSSSVFQLFTRTQPEQVR